MSLENNKILTFFSSLFSRFVDFIVDIFLSWIKKKNALDSKKTILIIDDKVELTNLVKYRLQDLGHEVFIAENGLVALKKLKKIKPNLIVLDINMPKMGGLEFYKNISTKFGRSKYPVLFLTERTDLEHICKDIDADGFLPKPFEIEDFITDLLFEYPGTGIDYINDELSYDYEGMTYSVWLDGCHGE